MQVEVSECAFNQWTTLKYNVTAAHTHTIISNETGQDWTLEPDKQTDSGHGDNCGQPDKRYCRFAQTTDRQVQMVVNWLGQCGRDRIPLLIIWLHWFQHHDPSGID